MDFTPGIFEMDMSKINPNITQHIHSTLCKQLALYVTQASPIQMAGDVIESYLDHMDAFQFIKDVRDMLEKCLDGLIYALDRFADLYDLVGITGEHTDNKYGWTNIRNAEIERLRDGGYRIKMPRALPIR